MSDALLVLNAGSSSLKFSVFLDEEQPQPLLRGQACGFGIHAARDIGLGALIEVKGQFVFDFSACIQLEDARPLSA